MGLDLEAINRELRDQSPEAIVRWAVDQAPEQCLASTNFGPHEAVILHMVTQVKPDIPILWADSGYNTEATYRFAHQLGEQLKLNLQVYTPRRSRAYREAVLGGIPDVSDEAAHQAFTEEVKLEPFRRGLAELQPKVWLAAIRKEQTEFRQSLDIVTWAADGLLRVSPVFHWTEAQLDAYAEQHRLPVERDYFDPTKVFAHRECGLHPSYFERQSA